jgi:NAD-dependent SIR2 family protein deacetylase
MQANTLSGCSETTTKERLQGAASTAIDALAEWICRHPRLFVLTGAGVSTASGIPDYRDAEGRWKNSPPVLFGSFMTDAAVRQRYWSRSLVGWRYFGQARPNAAHRALAQLGRLGHIDRLCTQNVDGLHQAAGSRDVVDLHGRLDMVRCMFCTWRQPRAELQQRLEADNPQWPRAMAAARADGDAEVAGDSTHFVVPDCPLCGGVLKPDVVFFGESVPRERVEQSLASARHAGAMLVVGSSLMVYSGYRFAEAAVAAGRPVAAINQGRTRADPLLSRKLALPCEEALPAVLASSMLVARVGS